LASSGTGIVDSKSPRIIGCGSDWVAGSAQYSIDANGESSGLITTGRSFWKIKYLTITGASSEGILSDSASSANIFDHIIVPNLTYGIYRPGNYSLISNCIFSNNNIGIYDDSGTDISCIHNLIYNSSSVGILSYYGKLYYGNVIYGCTSHCMSFLGGRKFCINNVCHGSSTGSGIYSINASGLVIIEGNSLTENGRYGIEGSVGAEAIYENMNGFRNNTAGIRLNCYEGSESFTWDVDPYRDSGVGKDFRLKPVIINGRRIENILDWNAATPVNKAFITAGLPPTDLTSGLLLNSSMLS
jgi:hypothetical protein